MLAVIADLAGLGQADDMESVGDRPALEGEYLAVPGQSPKPRRGETGSTARMLSIATPGVSLRGVPREALPRRA
ncbi:hypothetical protein ACXPWS_15285 [Mycobacterium sp. BMJ-28]